MKHYIELTLLQNNEIPIYFLWEKLYPQLHLAFVEIKGSDNKINVGVSFPNYDKNLHQLGCKLRLFSMRKETLENLKIKNWLSQLSDYIHITSIQDVPEKIENYAYFKRIQVKSSSERLARRRAKRNNENIEKARKYYSEFNVQLSRLPFIHIKSLSSNNKFQLFIDQIISSKEEVGTFSCYGLSKTATVPWF